MQWTGIFTIVFRITICVDISYTTATDARCNLVGIIGTEIDTVGGINDIVTIEISVKNTTTANTRFGLACIRRTIVVAVRGTITIRVNIRITT
jgi:hypothetical protein